MRKILFVAFGLCLFATASAQEQITNFENTRFTSPSGVQFVDTLGKKIVFTVYQPEKYQPSSLWVSDGTPANTKILQDAFGESPSNYLRVNIRKYGYRYLRGNHIWRTDGSKLERVLSNSDSLNTLQEFDGKFLLVFQKYEKINNDNGVTFTSFAWLDSLNRVSSVWERNVLSYQIIGSELHYIKLNKATKNLELHKVSKGINYTNVIVSPSNNLYLQGFEYYTKNQTEYYFLNTNEGKKLILKQKNDTTNVSFIAWSDVSDFQTAVKDTLGNIYFQQKKDSDIRLFGIVENGFPSEKWSYSLKPIYAYTYVTGAMFELPSIRNIAMIGDELVFNTITGSYGINAYHFNVLDLKSNKNRRSRNLVNSFRWSYTILNVTKLDSNTYNLDNGRGIVATYSFLADSIIKTTKYPFKPSYSTDSLFTVNSQKLLLSRNIYNVSTATKMPLIDERSIFDANDSPFAYKILGNKLLFWRYDHQRQKTELWASNGEKSGSELLIVLDGYFDSYNLEEKIKILGNKLYFYMNNYQNGLSIYETDGTKAGTSRVFKGNASESINWTKINEKQIVYRLSGEKGRIVIIEDGKATLLSNLPEIRSQYIIHLTAKSTYLIVDAEKDQVTYYKIYHVNNNTFKLIDENAVNRFAIYKDKLFYTKTNYKIVNGVFNFLQGYSGLYFIDETNKVNVVTNATVDYFGVYDDKLVYQQFVAENSPMKHTIIDLPTGKTDLIINNFYSYQTQSVNGVLILGNDAKMLLIKDKDRKEYPSAGGIQNLIRFGKGFLMQGGVFQLSNITYYDLQNSTVTPIVVNQPYERIFVGMNADYFIVSTRVNDSTITYGYWNVFDKKLIALDVSENFNELDATKAFSEDRKGNRYYWNFEAGKFTKSYELPKSSFIKSNTDNYYATIYAKETGNELIQLGAESLIVFPEIVKGDEGITLGNVFQFKNHLYIYAFTFSHGWQVWKMGEGQKAKPLSEEVSAENTVSVFPNPVQDMLNVDSQQKFRYRITNSRGQAVLQGNVEPQQTINFQDLADGLYIIQFFDGQKVFSKKVVKY